MRFASFSIRNFKSLLDFKIDLQPCTVLIGLNGSGKSTVLQAIDFICHLVSPDGPTAWINARGWELGDLFCKLDGGKHTSKNIDFEVILIDEDRQYKWSGSFNRKSLACTVEAITRLSDGMELLAIRENSIIEGGSKTPLNFTYRGSVLASFKLGDSPEHNVIKKICDFLKHTRSLELLSPAQMRKRVRGGAQDVGIGGERLSAYLHNLPMPQREKIRKALTDNYFPQLKDFQTSAMKGGGKRLSIHEYFANRATLTTDAGHVNDGMLRILAIVTETLFSKECVLIDEIEDGLNPELIQSLMKYLTESSSPQIIATTHSPLILNFLPDETARTSVQLIYKNLKGETAATPFFGLAKTKQRLGILGPGEVMVDVSLAEMSRLASESGGSNNG